MTPHDLEAEARAIVTAWDDCNCNHCMNGPEDCLVPRLAAALTAAREAERARVIEFVEWWHKATPNRGLIGDSRVAFDAQTRSLDQLVSYLKDGNDYIKASIECRKRDAAALQAREETT